MTRVAIYTRTAANLDGVQAQRQCAADYIAKRGWTCLPDRYDDPRYSGMNLERPALQQLLRDVESGKIDCVVARDRARLSRSMSDLQQLLAALERCGVALVLLSEEVDQ